ncbi:MAG: energy transducer TonB, partial [Gemmatimonadota bacterium]
MSPRDTTPEPLPDLPPELASLDRELSRITLEERPSFGPELRNELAREWARPVSRAPHPWRRHAVAACLAAVAVVGLAAPPARASLVEGWQRVLDGLRGGGEIQEAEVSPPGQLQDAPPMDRDLAEVEEVLPPTDATPGEPEAAGGEASTLPPFQPGLFTYPALVDPSAGREVALRHYPRDLQDAGRGGVVRLLLWVKEDGSVESPRIPEAGSSGIQALDQAALEAAPALRFRPAVRNGVPVPTWVEFDMIFEPPLEHDQPMSPPEALETPGIPMVQGWEPPESWVEAAMVPAPIRMEARSLLRVAMGAPEEVLEARYGPLEGVLSGDPPQGVNPLNWRVEVVRALEEARVRDPENPAPYLALARLRRKQGLRDDARLLFERGLARATRGARPVSPRLVAELAYESGRMARERWLSWRHLGEAPAALVDVEACGGAAGPGEVVSPEILLALNFTCPRVLQSALDQAFRPRPEGGLERERMLSAFVRAVEAYPAHVGANTELLLELAEGQEWSELLEGAGRFGWASQGHPNARLREGLALQRLGRVEEAEARFVSALQGLPPESGAHLRGLHRLIPELRRGRGGSVLRVTDPILSTAVDEREVEMLARGAYALLRFGSLEADAARVWVRYGRPQRIRAFGAGGGVRLEFWDYGPGPDLTFRRPGNAQGGSLTEEAREYLGELADFFPHWYDDRARPTALLPAQLARFRMPDADGGEQVRIRFRIPEGFRTGADTGALRVGLFAVGSGADPVEALSRSVPVSESGDVDVTIPLAAGTETLVVELLDRTTFQVAAARIDLPRSSGDISDLLLVAPLESGTDRVRDGDSPIRPLPSTQGVPDRVTVFAELYGIEAGSTYRLRFELQAETRPGWIPVESRP